MGFFECYLLVWVGLCIIVGVVLGSFFLNVFVGIVVLEYVYVNFVVVVFIWLMIYFMMI